MIARLSHSSWPTSWLRSRQQPKDKRLNSLQRAQGLAKGNLKEELLEQVCQQMSTLRKRTTSPPKDGDAKKQPRQ